jgi:site-specific recombinase XerD
MKIPTRTELIKIFGVIDPRSAFGKRDQAIIVFMANTGVRVSEMVGLNVFAVLTSEGVRPSFSVPRVWAKGKHSREIPLNASAQKAVLQLLRFNQARGFSTEPSAPLIQDRFHRRMPARSVHAPKIPGNGRGLRPGHPSQTSSLRRRLGSAPLR